VNAGVTVDAGHHAKPEKDAAVADDTGSPPPRDAGSPRPRRDAGSPHASEKDSGVYTVDAAIDHADQGHNDDDGCSVGAAGATRKHSTLAPIALLASLAWLTRRRSRSIGAQCRSGA
jgi:hypothetical protein